MIKEMKSQDINESKPQEPNMINQINNLNMN